MEKKPCKITTTRSRSRSNWVTVEARAGKSGTGKSIHKCNAFDNPKAIDQAMKAVLYEVRLQGYEVVYE